MDGTTEGTCVYTPEGGGRVKVNVQDPTHGGSSVRPPRTRSRNVRGSGIQPGVAPPFPHANRDQRVHVQVKDA